MVGHALMLAALPAHARGSKGARNGTTLRTATDHRWPLTNRWIATRPQRADNALNLSGGELFDASRPIVIKM